MQVVMTKLEMRRWTEGLIFLVLFCLTVPAANWMILHIGTVCKPNAPCLIPVAPGLMAPSGVLMIGASFVLRDLVQRRLGITASVAAILIGAGLSGLFAPLALVTASATAFLISELIDLAVYTPLARRRMIFAVIASGFVALIIDSMIFLWLAFGSLDFLAGQAVGKSWMVLLSIPLIAMLRKRDERIGLLPA
jgi:uncharacterized PurR-regulated membrane protein YhhQ (DUF165 family)